MELFSKEPYAFQVYDFVGDEFIKYLKKKAIPIMARAQVSLTKGDTQKLNQMENNKYNFSEKRTSMSSWLYEPVRNGFPTLSKKIGYLTGLTASEGTKSTANSLQIAAHATGGSFNLHLESTDEFSSLLRDNIGDRLATFMLYLNDVELGGTTAFTTAGVAVPPVIGSAVFWYDSKRNGEVDYKAYHEGCPVVLGEKWVGN